MITKELLQEKVKSYEAGSEKIKAQIQQAAAMVQQLQANLNANLGAVEGLTALLDEFYKAEETKTE